MGKKIEKERDEGYRPDKGTTRKGHRFQSRGERHQKTLSKGKRDQNLPEGKKRPRATSGASSRSRKKGNKLFARSREKGN